MAAPWMKKTKERLEAKDTKQERENVVISCPLISSLKKVESLNLNCLISLFLEQRPKYKDVQDKEP